MTLKAPPDEGFSAWAGAARDRAGRRRATVSCGRISFWDQDRKMRWQPRTAHLTPAPRAAVPAAQRDVRHARSCGWAFRAYWCDRLTGGARRR